MGNLVLETGSVGIFVMEHRRLVFFLRRLGFKNGVGLSNWSRGVSRLAIVYSSRFLVVMETRMSPRQPSPEFYGTQQTIEVERTKNGTVTQLARLSVESGETRSPSPHNVGMKSRIRAIVLDAP